MRLTRNHPVYGATVETLDQAAGSVLDRLDVLGLARKPLVLFTSYPLIYGWRVFPIA